MRILFTILSIADNREMYLSAAKNLINELLSNTLHDVLLTTNKVEFFDDIKTERFIVRNNVPEDSILQYKGGTEFNYNLKYLAFKDLPKEYDVIFYIDGDIKNMFWNEESENRMRFLMENYDCVATRLNCVLKNEIEQLKNIGTCLFSHKINSYNILCWDENDEHLESRLPSEHFLIFKYDGEKLKRFSQKWSEMNSIMQSQNGGNGSWGDVFEM
jgi:hypothetical protein